MIQGFKYVEFFVGNAKQASHYYRSIFGFEGYAYSGPETGNSESVSYVLKQNKIFFVFTTPLNTKKKISKIIEKHGDTVYDVAFNSNDLNGDLENALKNGALLNRDIQELTDKGGCLRYASIKTYGDTIHTLVDDSNYKGLWKPGYEGYNPSPLNIQDPNLIKIDHIVGNVEDNKMDKWIKYYENIFDFQTFIEFTEDDIATKYSALRSKVVKSQNSNIKLPINEPAEGLKKSQIQEYLDSNDGPGVQHIALLTTDIIKAIHSLRKNGMEFLDVPDSYYDELKNRVGNIDEDVERLKKLKILVDRDSDGYLLQLFTKPLEDRPTLFIEIIQRKGSNGFGKGNFMALFKSIEAEQAKRGNL